ncbi:olfactory receptor 10J5-like [Clarias gariepinus]|uniref:olfactory receptor 10J5-like n=1 Tax=Clarias gariepinus TaxID=13013 RepID=UPI00234CDAB0|nr:olfactory receptor 10J5-like [Clarias gariepinus]
MDFLQLMEGTNVTYLTLDGHVALNNYRYVYFSITLTVYISIIVFNTIIIFVIFINRHLHEPMYIFIAALLCNALSGATALYPKLLIDLLSEKQIASYSGCLFQAFYVYWYASSEFALLSAMAYDRYVAICKPLHYTALINMRTVKKLLCLSWLLPCCEIGTGALLISQLQLCEFKLKRIYCHGYSIIKLGCTEVSLNYLYGIFIFCIAEFPPLIFIFYSYVKIIFVCLKNSKDFRRKALQTCLPHLLIFIIFFVNTCFEIINSRVDSNQIPHIIIMILSVAYLLIPPLFNPIIYGLKLQEIFKIIKRLVSWKNWTKVYFRQKHGEQPATSTTAMVRNLLLGTFDLETRSCNLNGEVETETKLYHLRQGGSSVSRYTAEFRTLAVQTNWGDAALRTSFYGGLASRIKDELARRELPATLKGLIQLVLRIDQRLLSCPKPAPRTLPHAPTFSYATPRQPTAFTTTTLQPLPIPRWPWMHISLDFITGLPEKYHPHYNQPVLQSSTPGAPYQTPISQGHRQADIGTCSPTA